MYMHKQRQPILEPAISTITQLIPLIQVLSPPPPCMCTRGCWVAKLVTWRNLHKTTQFRLKSAPCCIEVLQRVSRDVEKNYAECWIGKADMTKIVPQENKKKSDFFRSYRAKTVFQVQLALGHAHVPPYTPPTYEIQTHLQLWKRL